MKMTILNNMNSHYAVTKKSVEDFVNYIFNCIN